MALPSDIFNTGTFRFKPAILVYERGDEKIGKELGDREEYEKRGRRCGALKVTRTLGACINGNMNNFFNEI
jgi:hypothetical protein